MPVNVWYKLRALCEKVRSVIYDDCDMTKAKKYLPKLKSLLARTPTRDGAIITAEAFAIYYELRGEIQKAITSRKREIKLMHALYHDIQAHNYDDKVRGSLLEGRDKPDLAVREAILEALKLKRREQRKKAARKRLK